VGTHTIGASIDGVTAIAANVYVTTYAGKFDQHNDVARTGANLTETVLNPTTVNQNSFGKVFSFGTDGVAHASPLYVPNVNVPGVGTRNVVYVATEHDSVYAFDADGSQTTPLWKTSFINPAAGVTTVSPDDVGECCDIQPESASGNSRVIAWRAGGTSSRSWRCGSWIRGKRRDKPAWRRRWKRSTPKE